MAYKFSETHLLNDKFQSIFGVGLMSFYDGLMSVVSRHLCIDILKFDDWLYEKYGEYEDNGQSMEDVVREHYGDKGVDLINGLI
mgnify:CR=1 FL=1